MLLYRLSNQDWMIDVQWVLAQQQRLLNCLVFQVPPQHGGNRPPLGDGVHLSFYLFLLQQSDQRFSSTKRMLSGLVWSHSADCLKALVTNLQAVLRLCWEQVKSSWVYFAKKLLVWSKGTTFFLSVHIECFLSLLYSKTLTASWK